MQSLIPGQNAKVDNPIVTLRVEGNMGVKWLSLVLDEQQQVIQEKCTGINQTNEMTWLIQPFELPDQVNKIKFVAYGDVSLATLVSQLTVIYTDTLIDQSLFEVKTDLANNRDESLLIVSELYRHQGSWKVRSVCQGFNDGIVQLEKQYNISLTEPASTANTGGVIDKAKSQVSAQQNKQVLHPISAEDLLVTLTWDNQLNPHDPMNNVLDFNPVNDMRIGAFYELSNGQRGLVQSYGEERGSYYGVPYIQALSNEEQRAQQLQLNTQYWHKSYRILVYCFILEGLSQWNKLGASIDFNKLDQININSYRCDQPLCAVAMIERVAQQYKLTPLVEFFDSLVAMDQAYGWGLPWRSQQQNPD
ncbi:TerD family protein [Spartinivicinus poritis]|uniref:TerD family protein n=1 Tax=Spartinivicinus poritis TaxID=2994640 RepID=A0ABT5U5G1_9GAMM|nr:TerD family protein [Spartinivicinus sp. A2-2]MDE1461599.1 TerD family protein [Spartinivicinus sp. A2-2]